MAAFLVSPSSSVGSKCIHPQVRFHYQAGISHVAAVYAHLSADLIEIWAGPYASSVDDRRLACSDRYSAQLMRDVIIRRSENDLSWRGIV